MKLTSKLRTGLLRLVLSQNGNQFLRRVHEGRRRLLRHPHTVSAFLQLDDPYSYLLAQHLGDLARCFDIVSSMLCTWPWMLPMCRSVEIESGGNVIEAATNGISAIFTARGEVLARRDHFKSGPGVVVADLPLYGPAGRDGTG